MRCDLMTNQGAGGLEHIFLRPPLKEFNRFIVDINIFLLTSMFIRIRARPPATMVAKTASLVVDGGP